MKRITTIFETRPVAVLASMFVAITLVGAAASAVSDARAQEGPDASKPAQLRMIDRPVRARLLPAPALQPDATVSRYVNWVTGDVQQDTHNSRQRGCEQAETKPGFVVLAMGSQREGGPSVFGGRGVVRPYAYVEQNVRAFIDGMVECGAKSSSWTVVIATSNYGEHDPATSQRYGSEWGVLVERLNDAPITVIGGNDIEPAWGSQDAGRAWREGYLSRTRAELLWLPSADGCPKSGVNGACSNGWSQQGLAEVLWGAERGVVLPQIYHDGGVQALQWAAIAQTAKGIGIEPRFAGVLTQQRACSQSTDPNCPQLDIAPDVAWKQMRDALDASDTTRGLALPYSSDIGWG